MAHRCCYGTLLASDSDSGSCTMYRRLECNCQFCDYVRIIYDCIIFQSLAVQSTADGWY